MTLRSSPAIVAALAAHLLACREAPRETPAPSNRFIRLPARTRQYTTIWNSGDVAAHSTRTTETWGPPAQVGRLSVRRVESREVRAGQPDRVTRMRVFVDRGAYGVYSTLNDDGTEERYDPPEVVIPAQPRVGQRWQGAHRKGALVIHRTCELVAFDGCPGGASVDCHLRIDQDTVHVVDHFCPDVGWIGEDASVFNARDRIATTTGAVIQDGVAVARSQRPRAPAGR